MGNYGPKLFYFMRMWENRGRGGGLAPFFICYADGCFHCALAEYFNLQ
jgi:hypothetical protein